MLLSRNNAGKLDTTCLGFVDFDHFLTILEYCRSPARSGTVWKSLGIIRINSPRTRGSERSQSDRLRHACVTLAPSHWPAAVDRRHFVSGGSAPWDDRLTLPRDAPKEQHQRSRRSYDAAGSGPRSKGSAGGLCVHRETRGAPNALNI